MNPNVRTAAFRALLADLPERIQEDARQAYRLFLQNPDHPGLRRHHLHDGGRLIPGSISVSVNRRYRAVYWVDGGTNVWYWIGSHTAYNRLVGRPG